MRITDVKRIKVDLKPVKATHRNFWNRIHRAMARRNWRSLIVLENLYQTDDRTVFLAVLRD